MPKTAAQLVPLKTQMANTLAMFRFADTSDLSGNLAYQDLPYDNSGGSFNGQALPGVTGAALPTTCVPPTNLALVANEAPGNARTTGLNKHHSGMPLMYIAYRDSALRESQGYWIRPTIPASAHGTASITINISYPAGAVSARLYKLTGSSGGYYFDIPNTISSITDTSSQYGVMAAPAGVTRTNWGTPNPNAASNAPAAGSDTISVVVNQTGGSFGATTYSFNLSSYSSLGESAGIGQQNVQIEGTPLISGAASGRMNAIALSDGPPAAGTLEAGKWYYQVTAYTAAPSTIYGSMNSIPLSVGAGHTESLPSPEVNVTRTATGTNVVTWVPVEHAAGYVIYRSRDLPAPVQSAPATATTGGTLPATTTYYYVVTALSKANGETVASNEQSITTGATATNTATVNWAKVEHAYGYRIYRATTPGGPYTLLTTITSGATITYVNTAVAPAGSTATEPPAVSTASGAGQCVFLAQVGTQGTTTYSDAGGTVAVNSGFTPPIDYNGARGAQQIVATWTASADTNVQGYYLYRNTTNQATGGSTAASLLVAGRTTATATDTTVGLVNRIIPISSYGGTNDIRTVGRYLQVHAFETYLTRLGFSCTLVQGKRYRYGVYDATNNSNRYFSTYFTASTNIETYYEITNLNVLMPASTNQYIFLQGEDSTCTIAWRPNSITTTDFPSQPQNEYGTMVAATPAMSISSSGLNQAGNWPTYTRDNALNRIPMKIHLRQAVAGASAVNTGKGTLLGDARYPRYAYSPNRTFGTPVRAIVPSWILDKPVSVVSQTELAKRWVEVAVSPDGGVTYYPLVSGERYVLPAPTTQLQFRYTLPEASAKASFDRRTMTGLPTTDNTAWSQNFAFWSDTGHSMYLYDAASSNAYTYSNGLLLLGNANNTWIYTNLSMQAVGRDVDMTMVGYFNQVGNFGIKFRHQGKAYQGYYFALDSNGNCYLDRQTNDSTATTRLATVSGVASNAYSLDHTLRVIAVGAHYLCFVNGRLVIDHTDTTYSDASYVNHGIAGARAVCKSFSVTSISEPTKTAPWELEYVTAYLET